MPKDILIEEPPKKKLNLFAFKATQTATRTTRAQNVEGASFLALLAAILFLVAPSLLLFVIYLLSNLVKNFG